MATNDGYFIPLLKGKRELLDSGVSPFLEKRPLRAALL
jgi:hypothetical protein